MSDRLSRRREIVFTLVTSVVLSSCASLQLDHPLETAEADWATDGHSGRRDRVSRDEPIRLPLTRAWTYNAGGGFSKGSPLVIGNTVIVGTRKGDVHAVDLLDGQQIGNKEFGRSVEGTPAVSDELLFVPNAWGRRALSALDLRTGTYKWRYEGVPIESSVLVLDDLVIAGDVEGNVVALEKQTGEVRWLYEFGDFASVLSGPAGVAKRVAAADETGRVVLLEADSGALIWEVDLGAPVESGLAITAENVFVPTTRGLFASLRTEDGSLAWEYTTPSEEVRFTSPAVTDTEVVFGGTDGILRSLRIANGELNWTFQTDGTIAGAPAISGDVVFVGSMDQRIYAVHRLTGSVQWQEELRGRVKSSPTVRNGYLVVLSEPRYMYAFTNDQNIRN